MSSDLTTLADAKRAINTPGVRVNLWVDALRAFVPITKSEANHALGEIWDGEYFMGGIDGDQVVPVRYSEAMQTVTIA